MRKWLLLSCFCFVYSPEHTLVVAIGKQANYLKDERGDFLIGTGIYDV
jgi:hypothetical protein